ncbi:MAG: hypothetical protein IJF70_01615, partial [Opitutales bacterium]|nr:hypothetical protein [Opitutales bacterium]
KHLYVPLLITSLLAPIFLQCAIALLIIVAEFVMFSFSPKSDALTTMSFFGDGNITSKSFAPVGKFLKVMLDGFASDMAGQYFNPVFSKARFEFSIFFAKSKIGKNNAI